MDILQIMDIYARFKECGSVTTDTRTLEGGEMFFALKGENFDGNAYALDALNKGARYAVVNKDAECVSSGDARLIPVDDTLEALQSLARWHRSMCIVDGKPLPVLALTGTNGKTTTKELIREVLSCRYNVKATEGNLNNNIGVPLTLLGIDASTQIAVVEMGASHPGDIKELVDIALPNYGLITNVGKAHLLGFGSFEGVMNTKGELYDYLRRTADKVFLNVGNSYLCKMASDRNLQYDPERLHSLIIPYGLDYSNTRILKSTTESLYLSLSFTDDGKYYEVRTNLVGAYNADNVIAAIAVGKYFGVPVEDAVKAIEKYVPSNNRSQMTRTEKNSLIIDAYNANPTSMEAALNNFSSIDAESRYVMLGNMLELGEDSVSEHIKVIEKAISMNLDGIFLVGSEFGKAVISMKDNQSVTERVRYFENSDILLKYLSDYPLNDALILIKGSRGSRMEKVISAL